MLNARSCITCVTAIAMLLLCASANAQYTWRLVSEPSDERPAPNFSENTVTRGWLCFDIRNGGLSTDCPVEFRLTGLADQSVGVTQACVPDTFGRIAPRTCGDGGHTHDPTDRPIVFPGTEVRYPGADPNDGDPLFVAGPSPGGFFGFEWTVSNVSGIYGLTSKMEAPPNSGFWNIDSNGVLFQVDEITATGFVNVTVSNDTLIQLPDSTIYDKVRTQNETAQTHNDAVSFTADLPTVIALTAIGLVFQNNTNSTISYNDMSLPKGGLFDFLAIRPSTYSPGVDEPWETPHSRHRAGRDVDVNKPGGQGCLTNTSVQAAVDTILQTDPQRNNRSALICEVNNNENYHIVITSLIIPAAFQTLIGTSIP